MPYITDYLNDLIQAQTQLSEVHMCTRFAERILGGLLGYCATDWVINPRADRDDTGSGIPDVTIRARLGEEVVPWVVVEAKLDDDVIRDAKRREALWADKRKYVQADTAYFVWLASRTVVVCNPQGSVIGEVYFENDRLISPEENVVVCSQDDAEVSEALSCISAAQAGSLAFLERFREGEFPSRYLAVTHEEVDKLTQALTGVIASLRSYLTRRWNALAEDFRAYEAEIGELEEYIALQGGNLPVHQRELRRNRVARRHRQALTLFQDAFPEFQNQQAYTDWEPYHEHRSTREDLEDIFRTNAAYVILGRLLFVRLAEDMVDSQGNSLISRKISNGGLELWRKLVGAGESYIGKLVGLAFAQAGSVFQQLFTPAHFDALIDLDDREFDRVLLLVLFRLNAFNFQGLGRDVLGDLYQKLLPRDLRKKMGEFYTDIEVVEYILHRTGFVEAARHGAPSLLDPACGSGTFLVRAAYYLIEGAEERGISDEQKLALVERCIHGLDINDFAVFLARVNLLFLVFDLVVKTKRDVSFGIEEANSLTRHEEPIQFTTSHGMQEPALTEATRGDRLIERRYQFVVGNPPYVRAERIPDGDRAVIQRSYPAISQGNTDLASYFVYRGADWLEDDGVFGMILPRAMADAGFAKALREEIGKREIAITELTPLDWACHELFDSDVVPFILQYQRKSPHAGHTVQLVQRVRSKAQLLAGLDEKGGPVVSEVDWRMFSEAAGGVSWPMEVDHRDLEIADRLAHL
jgi:type I restriction-modification system DNA methylase subunit